MGALIPPELLQSPLFRPGSSFGIMSGEKPRYRGEMHDQGHEGLRQHLQKLGLQHDVVAGNYDGPEKSVVIYNPSREQMFELGRKFGQEAVVWGHNQQQGQGGTHSELLYTNGAHAGKAHMPAEHVPHVEHFPEGKQPENYFTEVPGGKGASFRLNYDMDKLHPVPLSIGTRHPQALGPAPTPRPDLNKNLSDAADQQKARPRPHPHAYPWHDGHTTHNSLHVTPGAVLCRKNDGARTDQSQMWDPASQQKGSFAKGAITDPSMGLQPPKGSFVKGDNIGGPNSAGDMSVPPPRGSFSHMANTHAHHEDGQLGKDEPQPHESDGAKPQHHNPQAAGAGAPQYQEFAHPFGNVNPKEPQELRHYRYEGRLGDVHKQVRDHGFQTYMAGGSHGKPDLANKNYNTKHLMIYDPKAGSGGDFNDANYTEAWRTQHELAHALTYPEVNKLYGEGRRIGKLGTHRSLNEARRAVHWEWLAGHRQRELAKQMGVHISDEDFAREMNTIMHDAAHRAVTGKFTEPGGEGFRPHSHLVPLETAMGLVNEHGRRLGLQDPNATLQKGEVLQFPPQPARPQGQAPAQGPKASVSRLPTSNTIGTCDVCSQLGHLTHLLQGDDGSGGGGVCTTCASHPKTTGPVVPRLGKSEPQSTTLATEQRSMASGNDHKVYTPEQARLILAKALTERISGYADVLATLQKREAGETVNAQNSPEDKKWRTDNAAATAAGKKGVPVKPGDGVAKTGLEKVAPPGREEQVRALKPKVGTASAFKIAWASYNHGKETRKNMTGGSENMSSGTPGLMMGEHSMEKAPAPAEGADAGWDQPSTNMAMGEPHPENLREKQSVPVKTDDPRSNNFVTAGNNQSTLKAEPKDLQGKTDGRHQPLIHVGHRQQGTLAGDAKPTDHPHGIASGNIHPTGLPPGGKSPSNHNIEKADVPMAKPPSGNPTAAGAKPPQSHPSGGGMATPKLPGPGGMQKGLGGIMAGAGAGAAQGMQAAHASSAGNAQSVVAGGVLGGLKGAMGAAFAKKPAASAAAPAMAKAGEGALRPAAGGLAAGAQNAAHAAGAPAAAPKPQPSQAQHAARAEGLQSFMPAGKFTPAGGAPAAAPGGAAKPAAPAAAAKPAAPAAGAKPVTGAPPPTPGGPTATLKPPTHAPATTGGALGHLPKLTGVLNRNKAPGAGAAPAAPALKQSEKK